MRESCDKQRCSVLNCSSTRREKYHQYPKCKTTGSAWVRASGNPNLLGLTYEEVLEGRYVICCHHFRPDDYRCSSRLRKLKEKAVPSLLLPEEENNPSKNRPPAEEKIDVEEKENSSPNASVNVSPSKANFSPITFRNWPFKSSESDCFRKSSLVITDESNDSSFPLTPKSSRGNLRKDKGSLKEEKDLVSVPSSSVNCGNESETDNTLLALNPFENVTSGNTQDAVVPSTEETVQASKLNEKVDEAVKKTGLKSRACKRMLWKRRNLDEATRKMYEHVLEARKERDNYRTKSLRYCSLNFSHFPFEIKYTKPLKKQGFRYWKSKILY